MGIGYGVLGGGKTRERENERAGQFQQARQELGTAQERKERARVRRGRKREGRSGRKVGGCLSLAQ